MKMLYKALFVIVCIALILLLQLGFIFLILALMPSIVAYFIDTDPKRPSFKIVLAGNFSASMPTLMPMIKSALELNHQDTSYVFQNPTAWMLIYMGAAAGWCLVFLCRYFANIVVNMSAEFRIKSLQNQQERLIKEWGKGIAQITANQEPVEE